MRKIINFLDKHRLILIFVILLLITVLFLGINSLIFLNYKFNNFGCTQDIDDTFCYHNGIQIYKNPEKERERIFKDKKKEIEDLVKKYKLPEFNKYTSCYYEVTSQLNFNETGENEDLLIFFKNYNTSYNISNFYKKNVIYYNLFYRYKII